MKSKKNNRVLSLRKADIAILTRNSNRGESQEEERLGLKNLYRKKRSELSYSNKIFEEKIDLNKKFISKQYNSKIEIRDKLRKINSVRLKKIDKKSSKKSSNYEENKKFSTTMGINMYNSPEKISLKIEDFHKKNNLKFFSKSQSNFRKNKREKIKEETLKLPKEESYQPSITNKEIKSITIARMSFEVNEKLSNLEVKKKKIYNIISDFLDEDHEQVVKFTEYSHEISREIRNAFRIGSYIDPKKMVDSVNLLLDNFFEIFKIQCNEKIPQKKNYKDVRNIETLQNINSNNNLPTGRSLKSNKSERERSENTVEYSKLRRINDQIKEHLDDKEKMEKENSNLKKKLRILESKLIEMKNDFAANYQENDHNIHRMKIILTSLQEKIEENYKTIEDLTNKLNWHQQEENSVEFRMRKLQEQENRYREIGLMQLEEINTSKKRENDLIEVIKELRNRIMVKKLERNEVMTKESLDIFKSAEEEFKNQLENNLTDDYFYIKNSILNDFENFKLDQEEASKSYMKFSIENFLVKTAQLRNKVDESNWQIRKIRSDFRTSKRGFLSEINLNNLSLFRPNLSNLLSFRLKNLTEKEVQEIITHDFSLISLVRKIRAIFDSKWNEFSYYQDRRMYSKFSDFVYSWFGMFKINMTSMKIIQDNNISKLFSLFFY